jgi:hypothetical protein
MVRDPRRTLQIVINHRLREKLVKPSRQEEAQGQ